MKPSLDIIIKEKLQAFASESMQDIKENTEKKKMKQFASLFHEARSNRIKQD